MQAGKNDSGFTLIELLISMALGLIVMAALTSLFKTGMDSTFIVAQRIEGQQNMRAAMEIMNKDINMAGAGLPTGGVQLPTGGGSSPEKYGCDQSGTCYVPAYTYTNNYMYGIIPGYSNGVQGNATVPSAPGQVNDSITVVYADYNFPLFEYTVTFPAGSNGTSITVAPNPIYIPAPVAINSPGGIQVGDLILLSNSAGNAVGEVTGLTAGGISFAATDPLNVNQPGAAPGITNNIQAIAAGTPTTAYRLFAVTYYLTVPTNGQLPRLMRQVNGLTPVPVADNIINLQFSYDVYNSTTNVLDANEPNPIGVGESPNLIQKINLVVMGESLTPNGNRSQNMYLATSISARNMAFRNTYQ